MFGKDSVALDAAPYGARRYRERFPGCPPRPEQSPSAGTAAPAGKPSPHPATDRSPRTARGRSSPPGRSKPTRRGQPFTASGVPSAVAARRVLSWWNSQLDTSIIKILSHLPHEGTVRHSSAFDDTNSYFDFTHTFALKTISCDINNESSDFSHFNWTHRFYLTIWNGLLEFKTNYDTRNACHHNYINVIWEARLPFAGNRGKKKRKDGN